MGKQMSKENNMEIVIVQWKNDDKRINKSVLFSLFSAVALRIVLFEGGGEVENMTQIRVNKKI